MYDLIAAGKLKRYDISLKGSKVRLSDVDIDRYLAQAELHLLRRTS